MRISRSYFLNGIALLLGFATVATAGPINIIANYHLGDADPSAVSGGLANATTLDSSGSLFNLTRTGSPTYTTTPGGLGISFNGTNFYSGPIVTSVTDNFGIQATVMATAASGVKAIAYNGNSSNSGFGIYQVNDAWSVLYGGNILATFSGTVSLNQWTDLALVRDNGVTTFYINGTPFVIASAPNVAAGNMMIGGNPLQASEGFVGVIDEVRVFTFVRGAFNPGDLQATPEPATLGLVSLALAGLLTAKRKR